jgi:hypothetical protein
MRWDFLPSPVAVASWALVTPRLDPGLSLQPRAVVASRRVATFDTRVAKVKRLPGSAAKSAGKEVRRHHLGRLIATQSFYVNDMEGPLVEGELDWAQEWGRQLPSCQRLRATSPEAGARKHRPRHQIVRGWESGSITHPVIPPTVGTLVP